ncbi:hypothetical protein XCV4195 [Xanthomonas euvesicatoria pv. vesicatoria str. 85-10]|uniref:Uncharacterized protein n=1 Tax=Xanthomonas euvesicatoria pv. vesicatoria (strain 85-10) TaxID=316273 RepID=Q3BMT7_XANE5|nr:hypothetical protein XCV4195 [Xanthomonas euvesicatoria pv. vesicatoria str. 85-10]
MRLAHGLAASGTERALRVLHADAGVRPSRSHDAPSPPAQNVTDPAIRSDAAIRINDAARARAKPTPASGLLPAHLLLRQWL